MIHSNLHFVNEFLQKKVIKYLDTEELEKIGSSQLQVRYNSRSYRYYSFSGDCETEFRINPKVLKFLGSEYKLYTYIVLRLLAIKVEKGYLRLVFDDYVQYLNKRTFSNNERYFYLSALTDEQFAYEMDCILDPSNPERRHFFRILFQRVEKRNNKRLIELIREIALSGNLIWIFKDTAKEPRRHKGYRDHGSLGSEFSKTLKDQGRDYSIREEIQREEKVKNDFLAFLLGLSGRI